MVFLIVAAFAIGALLRLSEETVPAQPGPALTTFPALSAQLDRSSTRILVTNLNEFVWTGCTIDLNAGVPGGGYSRSLGRIGPGEQKSARLTAFSRIEGGRFDPETESVQVVDLHCDTPSGRAHHSGTF